MLDIAGRKVAAHVSGRDRGSANKIETDERKRNCACFIHIMTEEKLREFQERHRAVLESSAQSLCDVDEMAALSRYGAPRS